MKWLRLRPETLEELDHVDWRGQWKNEGHDFDAEGEDDEEGGGRGRMENFDDDLPGEEDEEEEEEEEEDGAGAGAGGRAPSIPYPPAAPSGRLGGRGRALASSSLLLNDFATREADESDSASDASSIATPDEESSSSAPLPRPLQPKHTIHFLKQVVFSGLKIVDLTPSSILATEEALHIPALSV